MHLDRTAPRALTSNPASAPGAFVQPLERRTLLHNFSLSDGILRLVGEATSQDLSVTVSGDQIKATLTESGNAHGEGAWPIASVKRIHVICDAGNDRVRISGKIKVQALITGGDGNDTIISGGGNDSIGGGGGDDVLDGGGGGDRFLGNGGNDTVDYSSRTANLRIIMAGAALSGETGERDEITHDIATVIGGAGDDFITGRNDGNDRLEGRDGRDTLVGLSGTDVLSGGDDNDSLDGGSANDTLYGGNGKDTLVGNAGNDYLDAGKGIDRILGSKGRDRIVAKDLYADVIDGGADTDSLRNKDDNDTVLNIP